MSDPINLAERRVAAQPDVVAALEHALEQAKSGEIRSIAMAAECVGHCTSTRVAMGDGDVAHLFLALRRLELILLEGGEEVDGGL